jgi:hypothetical protein
MEADTVAILVDYDVEGYVLWLCLPYPILSRMSRPRIAALCRAASRGGTRKMAFTLRTSYDQPGAAARHALRILPPRTSAVCRPAAER